MLYEKILADIKNAMIDGSTVRRDVLRGIISEVKNLTVNAGKEITDEACIKVLKKSVKQHNDSIESFKLGKREDLALKEAEELSYIQDYLPKMLTEEQTQTLILNIINENKITEEKKNFGKIMKLVSSCNESSQIDKTIVAKYLNVLLK